MTAAKKIGGGHWIQAEIYLAKPVELSELISVVARAAKRDFDLCRL
jgi:hypothetical protein